MDRDVGVIVVGSTTNPLPGVNLVRGCIISSLRSTTACAMQAYFSLHDSFWFGIKRRRNITRPVPWRPRLLWFAPTDERIRKAARLSGGKTQHIRGGHCTPKDAGYFSG
jgi:hypothetical protein